MKHHPTFHKIIEVEKLIAKDLSVFSLSMMLSLSLSPLYQAKALHTIENTNHVLVTKHKKTEKQKYAQVQRLLNKKYNHKNLGIYVYSLKDGSSASINGDKKFHSASTGKLPILLYTQKLINEKKIDPNKKYPYTDKFNNKKRNKFYYIRGGTGILRYQKLGKKFSIDTIMQWTCKYSDNQGANFLAYYVANGYDQTMIDYIEGILQHKWDLFHVSAKDNVLLLEQIYKTKGRLINYLSHTNFDNDRLPKYLPVKVAHKIGDVDNLRHDCGIVYTKQPYVICVMTKNSSNEMIANLSKEVYDILK